MDNIKTIIHKHNDGNGGLTIERVQDCTAIAEWAKRQHSIGAFGSSEMRFAGRIPDVIIEHYCNTNKITFSEFIRNKEHIKAILNQPELSHFRVWKGKV